MLLSVIVGKATFRWDRKRGLWQLRGWRITGWASLYEVYWVLHWHTWPLVPHICSSVTSLNHSGGCPFNSFYRINVREPDQCTYSQQHGVQLTPAKGRCNVWTGAGLTVKRVNLRPCWVSAPFISKPVVRYIDLCRTYNGSSGMGIPPIYSLHRFVLRWCEII